MSTKKKTVKIGDISRAVLENQKPRFKHNNSRDVFLGRFVHEFPSWLHREPFFYTPIEMDLYYSPPERSSRYSMGSIVSRYSSEPSEMEANQLYKIREARLMFGADTSHYQSAGDVEGYRRFMLTKSLFEQTFYENLIAFHQDWRKNSDDFTHQITLKNLEKMTGQFQREVLNPFLKEFQLGLKIANYPQYQYNGKVHFELVKNENLFPVYLDDQSWEHKFHEEFKSSAEQIDMFKVMFTVLNFRGRVGNLRFIFREFMKDVAATK